jgi:hypothetical protein
MKRFRTNWKATLSVASTIVYLLLLAGDALHGRTVSANDFLTGIDFVTHSFACNHPIKTLTELK